MECLVALMISTCLGVPLLLEVLLEARVLLKVFPAGTGVGLTHAPTAVVQTVLSDVEQLSIVIDKLDDTLARWSLQERLSRGEVANLLTPELFGQTPSETPLSLATELGVRDRTCSGPLKVDPLCDLRSDTTTCLTCM